MEVPLETLKSRLMSTSMRLDTSSPVLYTSASIADVQHPRLPLLLLLFLHMHCIPQASAPLVLCAHALRLSSQSHQIPRHLQQAKGDKECQGCIDAPDHDILQ